MAVADPDKHSTRGKAEGSKIPSALLFGGWKNFNFSIWNSKRTQKQLGKEIRPRAEKLGMIDF
jgi:hypothetical protein